MAFQSLYDLFNNELIKLNLPDEFSEISNFINDDKKSLKLIKYLVDDIGFDENLTLTQSRARHSIINFLLGKVFQEFGNIYSKISFNENNAKTNDKLWMYASLYHDYGYFSKYLYDRNTEIKSVVKYDVLTDNYEKELSSLNYFSSRYPQFMNNTYDEIIKYYDYSKYLHSEIIVNDTEKVDHGILGGALVFDRLVKSNRNSKADLLHLKMACITICQHNIFKSKDSKSDKIYEKYDLDRLYHNGKYFVTDKTPLLLFLSLVDTIECVKKFHRDEKNDKNFQTNTILKNLFIEVTENQITIDFSKLKNRSMEKGENFYKEKYVKYWKSLCEISKWTQFNAVGINDILSITMRPIQKITSDTEHIA